MNSMKEAADSIFAAVRDFVARVLQPIEARLSAVEARAPERGEKGEPGVSVSLEEVRQAWFEMYSREASTWQADFLGKAEASLQGAVERLPAPKDGRDGADGKSVTLEEVRTYLDAELASWALAFERRSQEILERTLQRIEVPKDGRDGEPGRDAAQIDVLPAIDPARRYQRGTFATHAGSLTRAFRATDPLEGAANLDAAGWQVVVNGIGDMQVEQIDERTIAIRFVSGDRTVEKLVRLGHPLDRGVFRDGGDYLKGDGVTFGGSWWIAQKDAPEGKPGVSADWRLAVKKGRDGRDGGGA